MSAAPKKVIIKHKNTTPSTNTNRYQSFKVKLANSLGALGYLACFMQWLWVILLYYYFINRAIKFITPQQSSPKNQEAIIMPTSNSLIVFTAFALAALVTILTIYIIIRVPAAIAKTEKNIVHKAAKETTPLVAKFTKKELTKKYQLKLTAKIILFIKIIILTIPVLLVYISRFSKYQVIDSNIANIVGVFLLVMSLVFFSLQYLLAKILKLDISALW